MKEKNKVDMDDFAEWSQRYLDLNDGWEDLRTCFRREIRFNVKIKSCEDKIQKLEAENERLREGIGFYANSDSYDLGGDSPNSAGYCQMEKEYDE